MNVIKRDGRVQNFDLSKIKTSITRASDDAQKPLTMSDIENVAKDIYEKIKGLSKELVPVSEVRAAILIVLESSGFKDVAKWYEADTK